MSSNKINKLASYFSYKYANPIDMDKLFEDDRYPGYRPEPMHVYNPEAELHDLETKEELERGLRSREMQDSMRDKEEKKKAIIFDRMSNLCNHLNKKSDKFKAACSMSEDLLNPRGLGNPTMTIQNILNEQKIVLEFDGMHLKLNGNLVKHDILDSNLDEFLLKLLEAKEQSSLENVTHTGFSGFSHDD